MKLAVFREAMISQLVAQVGMNIKRSSEELK